jgi:hypothetical protein
MLVTAYFGFFLWRLLHVPTPTLAQPTRYAVDIKAVKSDLCRLARSERAFFASIGHYASPNELRSNGDLTLPLAGRGPYLYRISVPVPEGFVIVASSQEQLTALSIDASLKVCILRLPRTALDSPLNPMFDCEECK